MLKPLLSLGNKFFRIPLFTTTCDVEQPSNGHEGVGAKIEFKWLIFFDFILDHVEFIFRIRVWIFQAAYLRRCIVRMLKCLRE